MQEKKQNNNENIKLILQNNKKIYYEKDYTPSFMNKKINFLEKIKNSSSENNIFISSLLLIFLGATFSHFNNYNATSQSKVILSNTNYSLEKIFNNDINLSDSEYLNNIETYFYQDSYKNFVVQINNNNLINKKFVKSSISNSNIKGVTIKHGIVYYIIDSTLKLDYKDYYKNIHTSVELIENPNKHGTFLFNKVNIINE